MPDTPIDLSEGIQSVRLKVPTAVVPIPPEGFAQLHSPSPGELALRLPDGSVVAIGGGGDPPLFVRNLLGPNGQVLTDGTEPGVGVDISPIPGLATRINGPLQGDGGRLYAPPPAVVSITKEELWDLHNTPKVLVAARGAGRLVVPLHLTIRSVPGATPYTVPALGDGYLRLGNQNLTSWQPYNLLPSLTPQVSDWASGLWTPILADRADVENAPLTLTLTGGAWTDGDGSLLVAVAYLVV